MLVDVTPLGVTGKEAEHLLDEIGITVNKNAIPFDSLPAEHRVRDPDRDAGDDDPRASGPDEMRAIGADHHRRDPRARRRRPTRHAWPREVREIVERFPVPGLPAA